MKFILKATNEKITVPFLRLILCLIHWYFLCAIFFEFFNLRLMI